MNATIPTKGSVFGSFVVDDLFAKVWLRVSDYARQLPRKHVTLRIPTERMAEMQEQGMTLREIARQLGCCHMTVSNRLGYRKYKKRKAEGA